MASFLAKLESLDLTAAKEDSSWVIIGRSNVDNDDLDYDQVRVLYTETPKPYAELRTQLSARFEQFGQVFHQTTRNLPTEHGDGTYPEDEHASKPLRLAHAELHDLETISRLLEEDVTHKPWNDRHYLLEDTIELGSRLNPKSKLSQALNDKITKLFWRDLNHPPRSFVGSGSEHHLQAFDITAETGSRSGPVNLQYRSADGSYNNVMSPRIGAANTPYARTVSPQTPQMGNLPDANLIFDLLLKRKESTPHPNGISSMLFYLATIIIHDLFRTSHADQSVSMTSSYLDLAPLYGSNQEEQDRMRTRRDGKIHPDCFSEQRVRGFPPGVSVLLIMFNRFHNGVVENLAAINENNRFDPKSKSYDEDLFQVGRLVTCGLYVNIIICDYIRVIVNLIRTKTSWKIDPRGEMGDLPRGVGNQVSAEFNLIYRWHAVVSERDAKWIETTYRHVFGKSPDKMSVHEMIEVLSNMEDKTSSEPAKLNLVDFHGVQVKRDSESGQFSDDHLVEILTESIEDHANAFGANQIPECLRVVEVMGIEQARKWQMCTLNEFRRYFNLKEHKTFEDINPDTQVASNLRYLYDTPDQVELYAGLMSEATKKDCLGSGLMPGFTISRGILSDAIALIRGDRFYTSDFHPKALTNWGYSEVSSNPEVDNGCCFYKLFFKAFPNHFKRDSVYARFPMIVPDQMRFILEGRGDFYRQASKDQYSFDRPARLPKMVEVNTFEGALNILEQPETFGVAWGDAIADLMGPSAKNFMLAGDGPSNENSRRLMRAAIYGDAPCQHFDWKTEVKKFYLSKTRDLLHHHKYDQGDAHKVDLVRDVTNMVSVYFCAEMFLLPMKSNEHPHGLFTEKQLYLIFVAVFTCVFFDADPEKSFEIHNEARQAANYLGKFLELNVNGLRATSWLGSVTEWFINYYNRREVSPLHMYGQKMLERLIQLGKMEGMDTTELVHGHIMGTAGGMVPNQGQQFAQLLDFYLNDEEGKKHWPAIVKLAQDDPDADDPDNEAKMLRYVLEGSRLACGSAVTRVVTTQEASVAMEYMDDPPQSPPTPQRGSARGKKAYRPTDATLHRDDKVLVNLWTASRDPYKYVNPNVVDVDIDRDPDQDYICFGWGQHKCLGLELIKVSLPAMLRVVAGLPNLRPETGPDGKIKTVPASVGAPQGAPKAMGYSKYLTKTFDGYWPFPIGLKVVWGEEAAQAPEAESTALASGEVNGHVNGVNGVHTNGVGVMNGADPAGKTPNKTHKRTPSGKRRRTTSR